MPPSPNRRALPGRWAVAAAVFASLLVGVLLLREPIGRAVFPDAALAGLVAQAESALAAGDLDTAAARFEAAQARAPDNPRVVDGLAATRERSLAEAALAVEAGDAALAEAALARAVRLGAPGERVDALRRSLLARAEPSIEAVLQRAAGLEADEPAAALALYRQVLQRAPSNALALAGRSRLLSVTLARATRAIDAGDLHAATALVADVRATDPAHLQLPELEARLGALGVSLPEPTDAAPLDVAVDNADAVRWRGLADEAIGRGAFADARRAIDEARRLAPGAMELAVLEQRLQRAEAGHPAAR
jgi:tetratricopeptide (TPR) repeat protein